LEQPIRIVKKIFEFVAMHAERFHRELLGHFDSGHGRILRNIADLVDLDARFSGECSLELFCQGGRFGVAAGKSADEARELRLSQIGREVDAGDARGNQQLSEAAFARRSTQGHTVEKNLIPRCAKKDAAPTAFLKRAPQLFPRGIKLGRSASVAKLIEPREFK
jgi:hypothetical protein